MHVLLDTNLLVRLYDIDAVDRPTAGGAIDLLQSASENTLYVAPQVLVEFWAVATRPRASNGLGLTPAIVGRHVETTRTRFALLREPTGWFDLWLGLVRQQQAVGKRVHDLRLAAVAIEAGVTHLLTFNGRDFRGVEDRLTILDPHGSSRPEAS